MEERRGQLQSEAAMFDLGPHAKVIGDALGELPPGYGETFVQLIVRDPTALLLVWDVSETEHLERGRREGWSNMSATVVDEDGNERSRVELARQSGTYRLAAPDGPITLAAELRLRDTVLARSSLVRLPPREAAADSGQPRTMRLDREQRVDSLRTAFPSRAGHHAPQGVISPARRLGERLAMERRRRVTPPSRSPGAESRAKSAGHLGDDASGSQNDDSNPKAKSAGAKNSGHQNSGDQYPSTSSGDELSTSPDSHSSESGDRAHDESASRERDSERRTPSSPGGGYSRGPWSGEGR